MENNNVAVPVPQYNQSVPTIKYGGFWVRWVAYMADAIILIIPVSLLKFLGAFVFLGASASTTTVDNIGSIINILVVWVYFILMTNYKGATLGKMLVGIKVVGVDGNKLSFGKVVLRETVGKFVSTLIIFIGYIMIAFTENKQGLHDKIANSQVVYKDPSKKNTARLVVGIIIAVILPVIVIVSIFASIVLVSLNSARGKASDAYGFSNLMSMRVHAEVYREIGKTYSNAKDCSSGLFADPNIALIMSSTKGAVYTCSADGDTYAISVKSNSGGEGRCIDSTAYSGEGVATSIAGISSCVKK